MFICKEAPMIVMRYATKKFHEILMSSSGNCQMLTTGDLPLIWCFI